MDAASHIGPYEIVKVLGTGGYGAVYLGRHRESGLEAAVKTVTAPAPQRLASLRREIRELGRLRHPGVVRILDDGICREGPWYAMELIVGTTLLHHVEGVAGGRDAVTSIHVDSHADTRRLGGTRETSSSGVLTEVFAGSLPVPGAHPPAPPAAAPAPAGSAASLGRIATVVRRLCGPLAYLHGEGIVHRDLKPENVVVRDDGWPVIVDFGLSSRAPSQDLRETMEAVGEVSGTLLYMAPEQAQGEILDARADLYALGCILYRLLTGTPPFRAPSPGELLMQHVHRAPEAPSRRCEGLHPAMEELVLRLLAKDPRERPGHARDVAAALESLGASSEPLPGPEPRAYLYRATFSGREPAMASIDARIERLSNEGQGGLVLVGGDPGIGKTRVVKEAGRRAHGRGAHLVAEECAPATTGPQVLRGFDRILQEAADALADGKGARELLAATAPVLAPYATGMRRVVEGLGLRVAVSLSPAASQLRLFRALQLVLATYVERQPTVVLLDDLHEADELTLLALHHLLRGGFLACNPLLVLASHGGDGAAESIEELRRDPRALDLVLAPLDAEHVAGIASDMLSLRPLPGPFATFLSGASGGNPHVVAQYLRTAVATGLLVRDAKGAWRLCSPEQGTAEALDEALPPPASLRELAARKIEGLPDGARRLLQLASVHGREVPLDLLATLAGLGERELGDALRELVRRGCVEERDRVVRFRDASVREAAYGGIDPALLPSLHAAAAGALEGREDVAPATLARHHELAGERARALEGYRAAGSAAIERSAYREAMRHYRAAVRVDDGGDLEVRIALANALRLTGRMSEAYAVQREAEVLAVRSGSVRARAIALHALAVLHHVSGKDEEAREIYEAVVATCRAEGLDATLASATANLALVLQNEGRYDEASRCLEEALAANRRLGNRGGEISVLGNLGSLRCEQGRIPEARALIEEVLALARASGDRESEAVAEANLANLLAAAGQLLEAERGLRRAMDIFLELGSRTAEGQATGSLGAFALEMGRPAEAHELAVASVAILDEVGWPRVLSQALLTQGRAAHALGRLEETRACFERAVGVLGEGSPLRKVHALADLGQLDAEEGRVEEARSRLLQALEIAESMGSAQARGVAHLGLAAIGRRLAWEPGEIGRHLDAAEACYEACDERVGVLHCLCERAHLAARAGDRARALALVALAESRTAAFGFSPGGSTGRDVAAARRAAEGRGPTTRRP